MLMKSKICTLDIFRDVRFDIACSKVLRTEEQKDCVNEGEHVLSFCESYRICHHVVPNINDLFLFPM
jgi:hypothetical protein